MVRRRFAGAAAGLVVIGAAGGWAATRSTTPAAPAVMAAVMDDADAAVVPWCGPGLDAIAGGGCFASPPPSDRPAPLVVYLHGMYDRRTPDEELDRQRRVAARARSRGYAVLALRGREGECNARPELATWFCWPSNERTAHHAPDFVRAWSPALREAERRTGGGKRFVLGFSNGAFFAGLLAVRAHFEAAAFAVAHGGPVEPVRAVAGRAPLLLMSADDDESQDGMIRFDAELAHDAWPHEVYARGGGHALTDDDIEAALTFFTRSQKEKLPLSPPLTAHRPQPHARDAAPPQTGEPDAADDESPQVDAAMSAPEPRAPDDADE